MSRDHHPITKETRKWWKFGNRYTIYNGKKNRRSINIEGRNILINYLVIWFNFHSASDSSTHASIRRSTNPTATPTRTRPLMIAAIVNISPAALHVDESAPPLFPFPLDAVAFTELTILAKHFSVLKGSPKATTPLLALSPPNELSPLTCTTFFIVFLVFAGELTMAPPEMFWGHTTAVAMAIWSSLLPTKYFLSTKPSNASRITHFTCG